LSVPKQVCSLWVLKTILIHPCVFNSMADFVEFLPLWCRQLSFTIALELYVASSRIW
jgi:hypothetical protein